MTLNGTWKFFWVKNADARPTDFWKVGFNDKGWSDMAVPGMWELNGFGDPIYVNTGYAWRNQDVYKRQDAACTVCHGAACHLLCGA